MRRRYVVKGRVQGVGYRQFAAEAARKLGLSGWVKNLVNGDVETEAQGNEGELSAYETQLRKGPALARVDVVNIEELPDVTGVSAAFEVGR